MGTVPGALAVKFTTDHAQPGATGPDQRSACGTRTVLSAVFGQCFWVHRSRPNIRPNRSCSDVPASCKAFAAKVSVPEGGGSAAACSSVRAVSYTHLRAHETGR